MLTPLFRPGFRLCRIRPHAASSLPQQNPHRPKVSCLRLPRHAPRRRKNPVPGPLSSPLRGSRQDQGRSPRILPVGGETAVRLHATEGVALLPDKGGNPCGMAFNKSIRRLAPSPSFPRRRESIGPRLLPAGGRPAAPAASATLACTICSTTRAVLALHGRSGFLLQPVPEGFFRVGMTESLPWSVV